MTLVTAGLLYLARMPVTGSLFVDVLPGLAIVALGSGLSYAPAFIAGTTEVPEREQGLASGLLNTSQELGAAIGLVVLGAVAAAAGSGGAMAYRAGYLSAFVLAALAGVFVVVTRLQPRAGMDHALTTTCDESSLPRAAEDSGSDPTFVPDAA
jgi:sugar phosphate permease